MLDELINRVSNEKKVIKEYFVLLITKSKKLTLSTLSREQRKVDDITIIVDDTFDSLNKEDEKKFYDCLDDLKELLENLSYLRAKIRLSK